MAIFMENYRKQQQIVTGDTDINFNICPVLYSECLSMNNIAEAFYIFSNEFTVSIKDDMYSEVDEGDGKDGFFKKAKNIIDRVIKYIMSVLTRFINYIKNKKPKNSSKQVADKVKDKVSEDDFQNIENMMHKYFPFMNRSNGIDDKIVTLINDDIVHMVDASYVVELNGLAGKISDKIAEMNKKDTNKDDINGIVTIMMSLLRRTNLCMSLVLIVEDLSHNLSVSSYNILWDIIEKAHKSNKNPIYSKKEYKGFIRDELGKNFEDLEIESHYAIDLTLFFGSTESLYKCVFDILDGKSNITKYHEKENSIFENGMALTTMSIARTDKREIIIKTLKETTSLQISDKALSQITVHNLNELKTHISTLKELNIDDSLYVFLVDKILVDIIGEAKHKIEIK